MVRLRFSILSVLLCAFLAPSLPALAQDAEESVSLNWEARAQRWAQVRARQNIPQSGEELEFAARELAEETMQANADDYRSRIQWLGNQWRSPAVSTGQRNAYLEIIMMLQQAWLLDNMGTLLNQPSMASGVLAGVGLVTTAFLAIRYSPFGGSLQSRAIRKSSRVSLRMVSYLSARLGFVGSAGAVETIGDQAGRRRQANTSSNLQRAGITLRRPSPSELAQNEELSLPLDYSDRNFYLDLFSMAGNAGAGLATGVIGERAMEVALRTEMASMVRAFVPRLVMRWAHPAAVGFIIAGVVGHYANNLIEGNAAESEEALRRENIETAIRRLSQTTNAAGKGQRTANAMRLIIHYFIETGADYRWERTHDSFNYVRDRICYELTQRGQNDPEFPNWPRRALSFSTVDTTHDRMRIRYLERTRHQASLVARERQAERDHVIDWLARTKMAAGSAWTPWYASVEVDLLRMMTAWGDASGVANYAN